MHSISLLERISTSFVPNSVFNNFEKAVPEIRILKIAGWIISQWRNIPKDGIDASKPYNPIRGEIFSCFWQHDEDGSTTHFIAEQVCHHPPISAFYSYNIKKGYVFDGFMEPKTSFSLGSATTSCVGRYTINCFQFGETYEIDMPKVTASGLLFGKKELTVTGDFSIHCQKNEFGLKVNFGVFIIIKIRTKTKFLGN